VWDIGKTADIPIDQPHCFAVKHKRLVNAESNTDKRDQNKQSP
jgi:hypothetical protein